MLNYSVKEIEKYYNINEIPLGDFSTIKGKGMTFHIKKYKIDSLGYLSTLSAKGFLGLMKMDTLVLNSLDRDMPLFSYDRIHAMGNDTFILEFYDTIISKDSSFNSLIDDSLKLKELTSRFSDHDLGKHWYDSLKLSPSVSKRVKSKESAALDEVYKSYWNLYLSKSKELPLIAPKEKKQRSSAYVNGLFEHGGPSTDEFVKLLGKEKARELFETVIFNTR